MQELLGWTAPLATTVAAMMTAANLGARITGWGFVVFTVGSICWSAIGASTGQTNLLATNGFLTVVNLVGIWRWLGRQAKYEDGGQAAAEASKSTSLPTLFTASSISGMKVFGRGGSELGTAVEALTECESARISYVVVRRSGLGERLCAIERHLVAFSTDRIDVRLTQTEFENLPELPAGEWPVRAPSLKEAAA